MKSTRNNELIGANTGRLRDALQLAGSLGDRTWTTASENLPGQRAGSHVRHILDFYDCFFDGLASSRIDYDSRRRDERIEKDPRFAAERIRCVIRAFENDVRVREDHDVLVRAEAGDDWLPSTVSRELQALSSHTIHHLALVAIILRLQGIRLDPDFGMSPSTLRHHAASSAEAA